ncbi:MAG: serine/threonine protein kinase [Euryarchaeota archaeon]|nr:serine/threonine protein kinase [Euryarchaeota archaeon]
MAFDWNATSGFYVFSAFIQYALAVFLIVKRPRSELSWVLALLFAFNASTALGWAFTFGFPRGTHWSLVGTRAKTWFDPTTSFLILYLALIYPTRVATFRRHPWLLRALVFVPAVVLLALYPTDPAGYLTAHARSIPGFLFMDLVAIGGWIAVLWRWTLLLPHETSPVRRRQFQFVFAAFGIRAAHMATFIPLDAFYSGTLGNILRAEGVAGLLVPGNQRYLVWSLLLLANLVALVWAIAYLVRARERAPPAHHTSIDFVILLLFLGVMEGILSRTLRPVVAPFTFWIYFDVVAVRPALLWMGVLRYQFDSPRLRAPAFALSLFGLLAAVAFFPGMRPLFLTLMPGSGVVAEVIAAILSVAIAGGLVFALRPYFMTDPFRAVAPAPLDAAGASQRDAVERYVASLEGAMSEGDLDPKSDDALARMRANLGISDEQHTALAWAVRSRWSEVPQTRDWIPGQTIGGRYRIEGVIGEGGTGTVYRADDVVAGDTVVLKRTHRIDRDARRVLLREAYAVGRLQHPHIVRFIATEEVRGEPVLVYEHLGGGSLKSRIAENGPLPADEAIRVTMAVLEALDTAHKAGVVHRDVKPSNILFTEDGTPRLADFGTAHVAAPDTTLGDPTRTGSQPGTLRYMSPEQTRGLPTAPSSDIYSTGVVLYECLTGDPLVPEHLLDWDVRKTIIEGGPPSLDGVPDPLRPVLEKALAKDPQRRDRNAPAFRDALAEVQRDLSGNGKRAQSARHR